MTRQYSDAQLRAMSKSLPELAREALAAGDRVRLRRLLEQMAMAHATLHTLGSATLARIWGKWHREFGEERTAAMLDRIGRRMMEPYIAQWRRAEEQETIGDLLALYKHQVGAAITPVAQDGRDLELRLAPCGSGGVMLLRGFERKMPQWYRRCEDGTPIFCRGCKSLQNALNEAAGEVVWNTAIDGDSVGACHMSFRRQAGIGAVFSDAQLQDMTHSRAQRAIDRVDAGDYDIEALIDGQQHDWKPWHDSIMVWSEYTFAGCVEFGGMDYLEECLKECYDSAFAFIYQSMEQFASDTERVFALAQSWHYHQGAFRLEEEDDRFVFVLDPCGSGGRLFREEMHKDMFHYGTELAPIVAQPHTLTFGREQFPLYCSHCASGNRDQFNGNPLVFVVDGHAQLRRGMACRQYVWKKDAPRRVEKALLQQVGMAELIPLRSVDP